MKDTTKSRTINFNLDEDKVINIIAYLNLACEACQKKATKLEKRANGKVEGYALAQQWREYAEEAGELADELDILLENCSKNSSSCEESEKEDK